LALAILLGALLLFPAVTAQAATIMSFDIAGSTTGCFGAGCTTFLTTATSSPFTFVGTSFSVTTDSSGAVASIDLGNISRTSGNDGNFTGSIPFALKVTFTLPTGVASGPDTFTAVFVGQATGGGGPVLVNFDNTVHPFTFSNSAGEGSFGFSVFDIAELNKNETLDVLGAVSSAIMRTPNGDTDPIPTVPEPASLLLVGAGAAWLAARRRTRATS